MKGVCKAWIIAFRMACSNGVGETKQDWVIHSCKRTRKKNNNSSIWSSKVVFLMETNFELWYLIAIIGGSVMLNVFAPWRHVETFIKKNNVLMKRKIFVVANKSLLYAFS
jgi:hypothetical protein